MEILGSLLAIAATAGEAAEASEEGGFGLNFDLLDTNLINLAIIIGVLVYFGRGFLGKTLSDRRAKIEASIREAEQRKQEAAALLGRAAAKAGTGLKKRAARIRLEAETQAAAASAAILEQATQDVARMQAAADQDVAAEEQRVVNELRQRVAALALQQVEARLKGGLSEDAQQQLIDRGIAALGG
ncbi:F0F1 ATP synthase subunit B [Leptolyngbya sp. O-77]|uniref:F0F1 ATP synthase subunit B n=1 Tax=Leptolyngbya sp. O-77 TaxID=1080068 RepID=UPI00074D2E58|nr:F0F1 ATP synthase subunit B [Leptolyngbya sp. O-77]BAU41008.1 ATP synthase subunit b, sodium ion specific [Leptolyngbya sp. O-77]